MNGQTLWCLAALCREYVSSSVIANSNPTSFSDSTGLKIADCEAAHTSCKTGGPLQQPGPNAHQGTKEQQANHNKAKRC